MSARKPNMVKMVKTERVPRVSRVRKRVWFQLWECCGFSSPCHFQVIYRACDCCASASTGRYLQQEPLVADDCGRVPVDDLGERQLPAVTQHHWYTCSLRHTHRQRVRPGSDAFTTTIIATCLISADLLDIDPRHYSDNTQLCLYKAVITGLHNNRSVCYYLCLSFFELKEFIFSVFPVIWQCNRGERERITWKFGWRLKAL